MVYGLCYLSCISLVAIYSHGTSYLIESKISTRESPPLQRIRDIPHYNICTTSDCVVNACHLQQGCLQAMKTLPFNSTTVAVYKYGDIPLNSKTLKSIQMGTLTWPLKHRILYYTYEQQS